MEPTATLLKKQTGSLSTPQQLTTKQVQLESELAKARDLENMGYLQLAKDIYSILFWNMEQPQEATFIGSDTCIDPISNAFFSIKKEFGEARANFLMGKLYFLGASSIVQNTRQAMSCFKKSAAEGYEPAFAILLKSASEGCAEAKPQLCQFCKEGKGSTENLQRAEQHLMIMVEQYKDALAALTLAQISEKKHGSIYSSCLTHFLDDAIAYYKIAVKGYPKDANTGLANAYMTKASESNGNIMYFQTALDYFTQAENNGCSEASQAIRTLPKIIFDKAIELLKFKGIMNSNESNAVKLLEFADKLGYKDANFELGKIYESNSERAFTDTDATKAISYYEKYIQSQTKTNPSDSFSSSDSFKSFGDLSFIGYTPDKFQTHRPISFNHKVAEAALRAGKLCDKKGNSADVQRYYARSAQEGNLEAKARLGDADAMYKHAMALKQKNADDPDILAFCAKAVEKNQGDAAFFLYEYHHANIETFTLGPSHETESKRYFAIALNAKHPQAIEINRQAELRQEEARQAAELEAKQNIYKGKIQDEITRRGNINSTPINDEQ